MARTTTGVKGTKKTTSKKASEATAVKDVVEPEKIEEPVVVEEEATVATAPEKVEMEMESTPNVIYANPGDRMMTVIHLYFSRTPVTYGNGKKKVFNRFGDKFSISVREFEQEFAPSNVVSALLQQRVLAVCDDCPKDVRERLDLNYGKGELLNEKQVKAIYTMPVDELCDVFEALCYEHKKLVAQYFADDFENNKGFYCDRTKIKRLNEVSKKYVKPGERGMFAPLLELITHAEEEDY